MIILHHALKELANADISEIKFNSIDDLYDYVENMVDRVSLGEKGDFKPSKTVYIFTYDDLAEDDEAEVFITSRIYMVLDLLDKADFFGFDLLKTFYLQEYNSFEEAYKVALNMKEISPLCYEPE